jgi:hypothetical protein
MYVHAQLAAETQLADGEFLRVAEKKGRVSEIKRKNSNSSSIQKTGQHFKPE